MKNFLIALAISCLAGATAANAEISKKEAFSILDKSVMELKVNNRFICSASRVDLSPTSFLTAKHCVEALGIDRRVKYTLHPEYGYFDTSILTVPLKATDDWAVINADNGQRLDEEGVSTIALGCNEDVYVGQGIAYVGYPYPMNKNFIVGYISSLDGYKVDVTRSDYITNMSATGGASGSPVISLDTGNVIGVLIEKVDNFIGIQSVKDTALCPTETQENGPKADFEPT